MRPIRRSPAVTPDVRHAWARQLAACASPFARVALANIARPYPNQPAHVLLDASGLLEPQALHPAFYGSYDWHSAVHMHWLLVMLLSRFSDLPEAHEIGLALSRHFTSDNIEIEARYFRQPTNRAFERTYGWAWLLKLQTALIDGSATHPNIGTWRDRVQPLTELIVQRYLEFLPLQQFPIRAGVHGNSAFGLLLALEYAQIARHRELADAVLAKSLEWYGRDRAYPAHYEPGGDDFLSGGLMEAALMRQVFGHEEFSTWWDKFCPDATGLSAWLMPVQVTDRSDGKLAHLDGLNLARAWCWAMLHSALPAPLAATAVSALDGQLAASLPNATCGHYAGTHWLASFALLALLATAESE